MTPLIHLDNVSIRHDEHVVLEHLSTEVNEGELVYLIGKTGSGKSSLLRTLYGDLSLTSAKARCAAMIWPSSNHGPFTSFAAARHGVSRLWAVARPKRGCQLDFALLATGWKDKKAKHVASRKF